jgi:hypothetical protein
LNINNNSNNDNNCIGNNIECRKQKLSDMNNDQEVKYDDTHKSHKKSCISACSSSAVMSGSSVHVDLSNDRDDSPSTVRTRMTDDDGVVDLNDVRSQVRSQYFHHIVSNFDDLDVHLTAIMTEEQSFVVTNSVSVRQLIRKRKIPIDVRSDACVMFDGLLSSFNAAMGDTIVVTYRTIAHRTVKQVTRHDMQSLKQYGTGNIVDYWVICNVIDMYVAILQQRERAKAVLFENDNNMSTCKRKLVFFTTFMTELCRTENPHTFEGILQLEQSLRNSYYNGNNDDIFDTYEKIIIPIFVDNNHWVVVVVDLRESFKSIKFYDSFHHNGQHVMGIVLKWLKWEYGMMHNGAVMPWEFTCSNDTDCPTQSGAYNCGVFCMMNMDFLCDDLPLVDSTYSNADMPLFRRKIGCDIFRGHLLY